MGGTGVIDRFLAVFTQYIDGGFGLAIALAYWLVVRNRPADPKRSSAMFGVGASRTVVGAC